MDDATPSYVLAFDTANEVIAIGLGRLDAAARSIELVASVEVEARRASNTQLVPRIDELCARAGVAREKIACVCVGRGPGSFTGVRIALATAKGIASALEVGLVGVSSLDAVAWGAWKAAERGELLVVADAMRREVYPVEYRLDDSGAARLTADRVIKAEAFAEELGATGSSDRSMADDGDAGDSRHGGNAGDPSRRGRPWPALPTEADVHPDRLITGDGLRKYAEFFESAGALLPEALWTPTGAGLLLALQAAWQAGECDPFDAAWHDPAFALPVYTRLSDAEENERVRLARIDDGLAGKRGSRHVTMNDTAIANARANGEGIAYKPLDARHVAEVAALEAAVMGTDAWNEALVADELGRADRVWWAAYAADPKMPLSAEAPLVGYAGGWVVDGDLQILKVGVDPTWRRHGIARVLLARVADDARNLGARTSSLEVRAGNTGAQALYAALGYEALGRRPRYYSDGEDALIMQGPLPTITLAAVPNGAVADARPGHVSGPGATEVAPYGEDASDDDVAGEPCRGASCAALGREDDGAAVCRPLILAIESSCDETAAAVIDGGEVLRSDVVATQVDFHARFGGVVPEIASRKHIEAICGVCDEALDVAAASLGLSRLRWRDLDAVAVTYAPGLVGALVVGVAFAKGRGLGRRHPLHRGEPFGRASVRQQDRSARFRAAGGGLARVRGQHSARAYGRLGRLSRARRDDRRCGGRGLRQGGQGAGSRVSRRPGRLEVRRRGRPGCHSVPPGHAAFGRFALLALGPEDRRGHLHQQRARRRARAQCARHLRELHGGCCGRAGGQGSHGPARDGGTHLLPRRRCGGQSDLARRLRADVRRGGRAPCDAAARLLRRQRRHDRRGGARSLSGRGVLAA